MTPTVLFSLYCFCKMWNHTIDNMKWDGDRSDWLYAFTITIIKVTIVLFILAAFLGIAGA